MANNTDVAIIGADPYGLSCSAYLQRCGGEHMILGSPVSAWRENLPAAMFLKSDGFASLLYDPDTADRLSRHLAARG